MQKQAPSIVVSRGEGVRVWDVQGKEYLDGMSGLWSNSLGNGNERLIAAATNQMTKLSYQHSFWNRTTDVTLEYAEKLVQYASHLDVTRAFLSCGGSDANDTNLKLAWYYHGARGKPSKVKVIARQQAYHGVTIMASSMSGLPALHKGFGPLPAPWVRHVSTPHFWRQGRPGETEEQFSSRLASELEDLILEEDPDTIAAFIAEPVMGAGGVMPPPKGYFSKIQQVLDKHDILLIADEVITGFGRLGQKFGSDYYGIRPDLITVAKAMSSSYVPLGASLITSKLSEVIEARAHEMGILAHGYTYGAHPVACAVGLEVMRVYEDEDILGNVTRLTPVFHETMRKYEAHPLVGEVRGEGFMLAMEFVADKKTKAPLELSTPPATVLADEAMRSGLLVRSLGNAAVIAPSLTFTEENFRELFEKFDGAFRHLEQRVHQELGV